MKTKLLKKLRKKAKQKIRLYQTDERIYKMTNPYSYRTDTFFSGDIEYIKKSVEKARRNYILNYVKAKRIEKKKYPILINI